MASTRIQHEFECSESAFWELSFLNEDFNRRLYLEELRFPAWRVLEQQVSDQSIRRRVEVEPLVEDIPAPIKKMMGERCGYIEEGTFDRVKRRYTFRVIPGAMPDKTDISGEMYCEVLGDHKIRRIVEFRIDVKVFMVGKLVEQKSIDDTRASYDKMATFLRSYLREKGIS
jgi:hypothetical protein